MVVISVSWKEFQKIDGECRQDTHSLQFVHKRGTHTQRAWLKNCIVIFVRLRRVHSFGVSCLILVCLTCLSARALHLPHSLFFLRHKNTQHNLGTTRATPRTPSTSRTSPSSPSRQVGHQESLWREDLQSGGNPRETAPTEKEQNVRTLRLDTRMMVSPTKLTAPCCNIRTSRSASPSQLKIQKLEDDLRFVGQFCPQGYKKSSQNKMLKILSSSQHLTCAHNTNPQHKPQHKRIAGTVWENQFSNLHHLETNTSVDLTAPGLCDPSIPDDVLRQVICQASHLAQTRSANV